MNALEERISNLKSEIEKAFADTKYPGDNNLLYQEGYRDDSDILSFYGHTDWKKVPDKVLEYENAALCFFSPEAYQFYIPRFLIYVLENYDSEEIVVDNTLYSLIPENDDLRDFVISKFSKLTYQQKFVIVSFLNLLKNDLLDYFREEDVTEALAFWNQFITNNY